MIRRHARHTISAVAVWCFVAILAARTSAGAPAPVAPRVVTKPAIGATNVDPDLRELRATFDQEMTTGSWSWTGGGPMFPEITSKPRWIDKRTCVLPVKLEPAKRYRVGINAPSFKNFRSADGVPAAVTTLWFETAARRRAAGEQKQMNQRAFEALRKALAERYSYYEIRGVDWKAIFERDVDWILASRTDLEWASRVGVMLAAANDIHVSLDCGGISVGTHSRMVPPNMDWRLVQNEIPNARHVNRALAWGKTDDGIVYILLPSWEKWAEQPLGEVHRVLDSAKDAKGIVIDVRANAGGSEPLARQVAAWFVEKPTLYSKNVYRDPSSESGWTKVFERVLEPNPAKRRYGGPVVVLMGRYTMSSCESFLLMMRAAGARLIGETSYGSSGNPKPFELPNGVTIYLPSWKDLRPDGTCIEGEGVQTDVVVDFPTDGSATNDPVLEKALEILRGPEA
jgi:hypothetical protein